MTEPSFVDTNVLVYLRDPRAARKQRLATDLMTRLWRERTGRTSVQVLNEYYVTVTRKLTPQVDAESAWDDVKELMTWNPRPIDTDILTSAREIEQRYTINWWDALVVAAAQSQHCKVLFSEDFQDGMRFSQLVVRNPFADKVQEPPAEYTMPVTPRPRHRPRGRPSRIAPP